MIDDREFNYIIPGLLQVVKYKKRNQAIYMPYGAVHITRKVISKALKQNNISYIALIAK